MTCESCAHTVAEALAGAGGAAPRVDHRTGEATFEPGEATDRALQDAVEAAGYRVVEITAAEARTAGPTHRGGAPPRRQYDLLLLGSGSAAFAAGIRARDLGASVALCESGTIGGTCVNIGCVPSKAMLAAADRYYRAGHHSFPGVATSQGAVDLGAVVEWKDGLVEEMRGAKYEHLAEEYGFTLLCGHGAFTGPDTYVCDGRPVAAERYLIATGAVPRLPPVPGLEEAGYLTSTTALKLREPPGALAVIGANAIGLEMGQLFARLGTRVTMLEAQERIAPFEEPEISRALAEALADERIAVRPGVTVTRVERRDGQRRVVFQAGGEEEALACDHVLVATGRRPNTRGLGLAEAGVQLTPQGAVQVDPQLRTSNPRIWAAGDVTPVPQFVYVAAAQGTVAAENAIGGAGRTVDWRGLPRVTFTSPQIAAAGMTEQEAREAGRQVETRVLPLNAVPRALVARETRGLFKLVAEAGSGRVLGTHVLAENAGDVVLAAVYAIRQEMTVRDLAEAWCPYLTMAEGLKLVAQTFTRDVKKLSCCAA
ncbi:MAG: mercury(II) reductase [Gemmatimonadetes bacterium]|nr:mercury(II) reductase [Gemmatimonadota bacterium]